MRLGTVTMTRNYTDRLGKNQQAYFDSIMKVASGGRRFLSMGEDVSSGVRAMQIRRSLARVDSHIDTVKSTQSKFDAAESAMMQVSEILKSALGDYVQAMSTGTYTPTDQDAIAKDLESIRDAVLDLMNTKFGGVYLFGGTNLSGAPITYDKTTGKMLYNGYDIEDIDKNHPAFRDNNYVDLGLGMLVDSNDGSVDSSSAFSNSIRALDYIGYGEDNLIYVLDQMIASIGTGSTSTNDDRIDLRNKLDDCISRLSVGITSMGGDSNYLDYTLDRLEKEKLNLISRQDTIEFMGEDAAISEMNMREYVYNVSLQVGARILSTSLFNYLS